MVNLFPSEGFNIPVHNHITHILESENNGNGMLQQVEHENETNRYHHNGDHHDQLNNQHENHHHDYYNHDQNANGNGGEMQTEDNQEGGDGEMEAVLPAWALAQPIDGYIKHPVAGLVMHPSFYDNRHLINLSTKPRYIYDGEVDGPLCPPGQKCTHIKNCFEIRVRMAVLAYRMHNISFRDAEYIWRVSRSTIQRRKAALDKCDPIIFLITPDHGVP